MHDHAIRKGACRFFLDALFPIAPALVLSDTTFSATSNPQRIEDGTVTRVSDGGFAAGDREVGIGSLRKPFGSWVFAYESIRHASGEAAGTGPTRWIMPASITSDRDRAAQNGAEAVMEYVLLSQCDYLVHNGSSIARTVLLNVPYFPHTNTP